MAGRWGTCLCPLVSCYGDLWAVCVVSASVNWSSRYCCDWVLTVVHLISNAGNIPSEGVCVCVSMRVSHQWCRYMPCVRHRLRPSWPEEQREVRTALREQLWHTQTHSSQTPTISALFPCPYNTTTGIYFFSFFSSQQSHTYTTPMASEIKCGCDSVSLGFASIMWRSSSSTPDVPLEGTVTPQINSSLSDWAHTLCLLLIHSD